MKTQYKPIAMRCTKEQFDSIKDRVGLPIKNIYNFEDYSYLTNYFNFTNVVSNIKSIIIVGREIIENLVQNTATYI